MNLTNRMAIAATIFAVIGAGALVLVGFFLPSDGSGLQFDETTGEFALVQVAPHMLFHPMAITSVVAIWLAAILAIVAMVRTRRGL